MVKIGGLGEVLGLGIDPLFSCGWEFPRSRKVNLIKSKKISNPHLHKDFDKSYNLYLQFLHIRKFFLEMG